MKTINLTSEGVREHTAIDYTKHTQRKKKIFSLSVKKRKEKKQKLHIKVQNSKLRIIQIMFVAKKKTNIEKWMKTAGKKEV